MQFANFEPVALELTLPWQGNPEQEKRFKKLLIITLIALALLAAIVPWLPVFEPEYAPPEQTITKTRVVLDPVVTPTPEPVEPEMEPEAPAPAPQPEPVPEPKRETRTVAEATPAPAPKVEEQVKDKQSVMQEQGLADLSDELSALRGTVSVSKLQRKNVSKNDLGRREHSSRDRFGEENASRRSQGIQVDDDALKQEQVSLADYQGVAVEATAESDRPGGSQLSYLSGQAGSRDMENIRRTFEAAKSRVYALYLQALNDNPNLAGKFVFRLVIEPDGSISELELVASELGVRGLENTILERVQDINFGPKEVSPTAVEYAFSFIPS